MDRRGFETDLIFVIYASLTALKKVPFILAKIEELKGRYVVNDGTK